MFGKLFNKKEDDQPLNKEQKISTNPAILPFEMLVMTYLENYGLDKFGNITGEKVKLSQKDIEWIELTLKAAGFYEKTFIEELAIEEWNQIKEKNKNLTPLAFSKEFVKQYHNSKIEKFAPDYVIERNKKIAAAYSYLIKTIGKIQGCLDDDVLRTRIESDFRQRTSIKSTISQCTTPFCIISLGCDEMGRYNLVYSVDHRFQEMISENFASTLIRRIYEFTPGEMEPFVRIGSLYNDCIKIFNQLVEEAKTKTYHKIIINEKHEI